MRGRGVTFLDLLPVVDALVLGLVVVEGVYVHLFGVVAGDDLGDEEPVGEIDTGVADCEGEVQGVEPAEHLSGHVAASGQGVHHDEEME